MLAGQQRNELGSEVAQICQDHCTGDDAKCGASPSGKRQAQYHALASSLVVVSLPATTMRKNAAPMAMQAAMVGLLTNVESAKAIPNNIRHGAALESPS